MQHIRDRCWRSFTILVYCVSNWALKQQANIRKNRSAEGADTSKGKVHFDGDRAKLNKIQRASLNGLEVLAKTLGVQIYVEDFEGTKNANKNGWYDPKDGSIHINLKAGMDGKGTMIFTVAHELTHFIKQWSPAKFEVLANFLTKQYTAKGQSIAELVEAQQDKAARNGRELSREEALEEMVADSMESMLSDGSIIEMMAELKQQDQGLWQKIRDWFKDLAGKLQAVVDAYKGVQPDSTEGRMVADMKDMIGTLQALYMDALVDASENFDAGVQKITTEDSGGVKYSLNRNAKTELHKALYDRNYRDEVLLRDETPAIMLAQKGVKNLPMAMNASHIRENVFTEEEAIKLGLRVDDSINYHGLGEDFFLQIIDGLDNVKEAYRGTKHADNPARRENYFLLVSEFTDKDGNTVNVPVYINEHARYNRVFIDINKISTVFGKKNFKDYIRRQLQQNNIVRIKNKNITASESSAPIAEVYSSDVSENSIRNPNGIVNKKISDRASDGSQLSERQQEYFKDSKERDNQGRLRVMYRGDSTEVTVFDRKKSSYSNLYGRGFYFTGSDSHAGQYGQATAYYLNITNPVSTTDCTITKEQMRKFLEAVAENEDDYSFENYGYGATVESVLKSVFTGKSDFAMLYDVSQTAIGDMVEAVELFNKTNGTNYDGFILDTETVIFDSAQAKRTDNRNPTANPDTRYSQRDVGRQEAVTQALEKENVKLREDVAELRELVKLQRQVTNGTKFTKTSVEAAARYLKQSTNAKGSTQELMKLLNGLYEYIASAKELAWEDVKEQAQGAVDWLWERIDGQGKPTEYAPEHSLRGVDSLAR